MMMMRRRGMTTMMIVRRRRRRKDNDDDDGQTSYLSKDLRDHNFGHQKFTQKKQNLR